MATLKYRCLVLDHDDTVVESTRCVHYPAFLLGMEELRGGVSMTLEEFFLMNFQPGIHRYYREVARLDDEEYRREYEIWQAYVREHVPAVYPGMRRILERQRALGGYVCVSSHSVKEQILRDYRENGLAAPDRVYGWELPAEKRKPSTYALEDILKTLGLSRKEILVVDDLRFGCEMAHACGVKCAGAGWAHDIPEIRAHMEASCDAYFRRIEELEAFLFEG